MPYRLTGAGGFGFSINWEKVPGDEQVALAVITFLEDRRLLFGKNHLEDEAHCVISANEIRHFLTDELSKAKAGRSLAVSIRHIRAALRAFVEEAGPDGRNFRWAKTEFAVAIGDLRGRVGLQVALIAEQYDIAVELSLGEILPPLQDEDF